MAHSTCDFLVSGGAHPDLAKNLANELGVRLIVPEIAKFADGEIYVRVADDVRNASISILQPTCPPVHDNFVTLALLADAIRNAGAARVTAVTPYLGYARQDVRHHAGEARSFQLFSQMLDRAGIDHLIAVDIHSPALESALPMPSTLLNIDQLFGERIRRWGISDAIIVTPDAGGLKRAERIAAVLDASLAAVSKVRPHHDEAKSTHVLGEVRGRRCVLVDDMISTGQTLVSAASALYAAGAKEVHAAFTHAIMAPGTEAKLVSSRIQRFLTTDSVPSSLGTRFELVSIVPLLAAAIRHSANRIDDGDVRAEGGLKRV